MEYFIFWSITRLTLFFCLIYFYRHSHPYDDDFRENARHFYLYSLIPILGEIAIFAKVIYYGIFSILEIIHFFWEMGDFWLKSFLEKFKQ